MPPFGATIDATHVTCHFSLASIDATHVTFHISLASIDASQVTFHICKLIDFEQKYTPFVFIAVEKPDFI